jgi:hypothetical protein
MAYSFNPDPTTTSTARAIVDSDNSLFAGAGQPGDHVGGIVADSGAQAGVASGSKVFSAGTPYSASILTEISFTNQSTISQDYKLTITAPAPAGLLLGLTGLPVLGIGAWIRRRTSVVA